MNNNFRSQLELFLQAAGFESRDERSKVLDQVEDEIILRTYRNFEGQYNPEQFGVELKNQNKEIMDSVKENTQSVLAELFRSAIDGATEEEKKKFEGLVDLFKSSANIDP